MKYMQKQIAYLDIMKNVLKFENQTINSFFILKQNETKLLLINFDHIKIKNKTI